ncbi:hypothetical protein FIBSPDRAFT_388736 [Athelia psychrophila]|uniref:Uncharacterized protein n=1 Tax=Athelia psychrophila TaxID=1759441 RepID=A0A166NTI4_9AGAM|nr:hypothetical protein FIBSPDRAFT_388736 [Fibularhizoctonia sp. CBS 109695]
MVTELPLEIWLHILSCTIPTSPFIWEYQPFNSPEDELERERERRTILAPVVLVCRAWRALAERMVYENIDLDCDAIKPALEIGDHRGAYVRRAVLLYQSTQPLITRLGHLPNLNILRLSPPSPRPGEHTACDESDSDGIPFPPLKRLDWWNIPDATRSSDINSLYNVLLNTPHIQYLTLGGSYGEINTQFPVHLPEVTTLNFQRSDMEFAQQILALWSMPALTHLIYTGVSNYFMFMALVQKFGAQLRTLELSRSMQFCTTDYLWPALTEGRALHEIGYFVNSTLIPRRTLNGTAWVAINGSVRVVRLHGQLAFADEKLIWDHLEEHFAFLAGAALPALETVVLHPSHGIWDEITSHPRFAPLGRALRGRGCVLQRADGERVS